METYVWRLISRQFAVGSRFLAETTPSKFRLNLNRIDYGYNEMVPSSSRRSSSRRSSILKPPKPRQPLQNLNFNTSSNESSPATAKIKRRVSFAEKKHVKEFCNSVDQGTVWDNTYEEHDLSYNKVQCASNQEECNNEQTFKGNVVATETCSNLICVASEIVEICSTQEINVHFASNETSKGDVNLEECDLNFTNIVESTVSTGALLTQEEVLANTSSIIFHGTVTQESESVSSSSVKNDSHASKSIIVYEDPNQNEPDEVLECPQSNVNTFSCNHMNVTSIQDTNMEFTEVVHSTVYPGPSYIQSNDLQDALNDSSMDFTQAVPMSINILQQKENIENLHLQYSAMKSNVIERKEIEHDISMELTVAIPSIIKSIDNAGSKIHSTDDRSEKFDDISMEITAAVPTIIPSSQQFSSNQIDDYDMDSVSRENNNRSIIFHDTSMDITKPVKTNIDKDLTCRTQETSEYTHDVACTDDHTKLFNVSMEMTKAIPVDIHSTTRNQGINVNSDFENIKHNINSYGELNNLEKTRICNDESMDFTVAITAPLKKHGDTVKNNELTENTSCVQWNSQNLISNNCESDNMYSISDRTRIFHDTSMTTTAVVSSLNARGDCEEEMVCERNLDNTILFPNTSMEITEAIMVPQGRTYVEDPVLHAAKVGKSMSLNNFENRDLETFNESSVPDNVLRDITDIVVPSVLNSDMNPDKENFSENMRNNITKETVAGTVDESVNIPISMALHESKVQDASASNESNPKTAYAPFNSASDSPSCVITSELKRNTCLQHECSLDVMLNPRRTYTVQQLSTDRTCTITNKGDNEISKISDDTVCQKIDNNENATQSNINDIDIDTDIQNNIDILNNVDNFQERSAMIFNASFEELESIKPPSFVFLDDMSSEDIAADIASKFNYRDNSYEQNDQTDISERVRKSQTFLFKGISSDCEQESSKFEYEDRIQSNKVLELSNINRSTMETPVLECSSSTINDNDRFPVTDTETNYESGNIEDLCLENSNIEDQHIELYSSNRNDISRGIPKYNMENNYPDFNNWKLSAGKNLLNKSDTETRKAYSENCLNVEEHQRLEPDVSSAEKEISIQLDPFSSLLNELKICAESDDIIWNVYHENIERKLFVVGFMSCSLLVVIYLTDDCGTISDQFIKEIKFVSRLADDADELISLVHRIILEKLDSKRLMDLYKSSEDVYPMLDHVTKEVKLAMDFMFELNRLNDLNLMEITRDRISFVLRTRRMDIVLRIAINMKPFDRIDSQDISVNCLLGSVREDEIKKLIKNIKRDHKFLRRYVSDVRDYIHLIEDCSSTTTKY